MKACVLLACTMALVAATPSHNGWHQFKAQFGKQYRSSQEAAHRMSVFEQNQQFIDDHNQKFEDGLVTFTLKMNQFGDLTTDEINQKMNVYQGSHRRHPRLLHQAKEEELPATVDWRSNGAVTPVKDQKDCGSCWAFSATGSLEGQHFLSTKELVSLSEQNLIDCSDNYGNRGCHGGVVDSAFKYIKDNGGINTEESYPYEAKNGPCRFSQDVGATLTGFVDVQKDSEKDLKHAVATVGPVSVAIDASQKTFHFYSSGTYYDPHCSSTSLNHAVLAAGYGSDPEDYWLVKNSWNESWGDKGYIKMARNRDNNCGIATQASYPTV